MKIDILTHGDPSQFNTKDGAYLGGGVGFVTHLLSALSALGCDLNVVVDGGMIRKDADVYFLSSFGVNEERNDKGKRNSDLKYQQLNEVGGKKFVLIHGVAEFRFYKHSLEHLKQLKIDKVILTGNSEAINLAVKKHLPDAVVSVIPMPFKFDLSQFADRSKLTHTIISPARIAAAKNTTKILDIAQRIQSKTFLMCGLQKGMYWHYAIEPNKQAQLKNLKWLGARSDVFEPYKEAAFSIDLTAFWFGKILEGKRTQYTTLEAVNCGCIPITWKHWDNDSWHGIFLTSPQKEGNRIVWDVTECLELIKNFSYDAELARHNLESLMEKQNIDVIGKRYMEEFKC